MTSSNNILSTMRENMSHEVRNDNNEVSPKTVMFSLPSKDGTTGSTREDDKELQEIDGDGKPYALKTDEVYEVKSRLKRKQRKWTALITMAALLLALAFILIAFLIAVKSGKKLVSQNNSTQNICNDKCNIQLVETIPIGMSYAPGLIKNPAIVDKLKNILNAAQKSIDIASSYWTLRGFDVKGGPYPMAKVGEEIFDGLVEAATKRGVKIRIVHQVFCRNGKCFYSTKDTTELKKIKGIEIRTLDMEALIGAGIIHTKMWIVDGQQMYLGSANMDWRSYTEVKELGLMTYDCPCLADDMSKIFGAYWMLAQPNAKIPAKWPTSFDTKINKDSPLLLNNGSIQTKVFFGSSPPQFCPSSRTTDIDALLNVIQSAKNFIYIAVMDYLTAVIYSKPKKYWGVIDNALRSAAYDRGIEVRLMMSNWTHIKMEMLPMLKSIQEFSGACKNGSVTVKLFTVPPGTMDVPYSRVNHNKYMVTETTAYVGTSNWSGDYFISTAGIGYVISQKVSNSSTAKNAVQNQLKQVFERDWSSKYASRLS